MGRTLTAAALLLVLMMLAAACSRSDEVPPTETGPSQQELLDAIERMDREMESLREELREGKDAESAKAAGEVPQQTEMPSSTRTVALASTPTAAPTATPAPEKVVIPTPSAPGICGRTPEVQRAIIGTLKLESCRLIIEHELYRIRVLSIEAPELAAGDFAGLVNLESLHIGIRPSEKTAPAVIPAGVFAGSRVKHLRISSPGTSDTHVTIEDGSFDGAHVEVMEVHLAAGGPVYDQSGESAGRRTPGRLPDRLPESLTQLQVSGDLRRLDWEVFQALPELETLSLTHKQERPEGTPTPTVISIPREAFSGNPKLKALELDHDQSYRAATYRVDAGLLAEHEHLARVSINRLALRGPKPQGLPVQFHPDSPAAAHVAEKGTEEWKGWEDEHGFRLP